MNTEEIVQSISDPELSVVVAVIEGGSGAMETCLKALDAGSEGIRLECIVPFDARLDNVGRLAKAFPEIAFIDSRDHVDTEEFGSNSREHHDILRAIGLRHATAPIIALLEDHGTPDRGWSEAVLKAHRESDAAAIGGAVENGMDRILNWAVYYCDFGRYQNPVPDGEVEFASDSNISYKRDALMCVKPQWLNAFHETSVNWELRRQGGKLRLDPKMVVFQTRRSLRFAPALKERFVWGRSFAGTRAAEVTGLRRLIFAAFSFVLPFLLTSRILLQGFQKGRYLGKLLCALPLIFFLQMFWAAGEFVGYVTGRAERGNRMRTQVSSDTV
jgi:hypothetical protein